MTTNLEIKTFGPLEIKNAEKGEVAAVVATLGVVDKDGDVILPGAIPNGAKVKLSSYAHDVVLDGAPPAGKGTISEEDGRAVFRGHFFMSTDHGQQAFLTAKELGAEGEWSFGFPRDVKTEKMTDEWKAKGARRLIAGMLPVEASPVFQGAGMGTQTMWVKDAVKEAVKEADEETARAKADEEAAAKKAAEEAATKEQPTALPVPTDTEQEDEFMARCMADPTAVETMLEHERQAWCDQQWESSPRAAALENAAALAKQAEVEAEAKRLAEEATTKARAQEDRELYEGVQRRLKRMGLR